MSGAVSTLTRSQMTVSRLLDRSAQLRPDKVAVLTVEASLTYAALQALSCRFARLLQSKGITRADRVALMLPNSPQFVVCFFAIARIGAILVPLNPAYTDELRGILLDAGVRDLFCVPAHRDRLEAMRADLPGLRSISPRPASSRLRPRITRWSIAAPAAMSRPELPSASCGRAILLRSLHRRPSSFERCFPT